MSLSPSVPRSRSISSSLFAARKEGRKDERRDLRLSWFFVLLSVEASGGASDVMPLVSCTVVELLMAQRECGSRGRDGEREGEDEDAEDDEVEDKESLSSSSERGSGSMSRSEPLSELESVERSDVTLTIDVEDEEGCNTSEADVGEGDWAEDEEVSCAGKEILELVSLRFGTMGIALGLGRLGR